MTDAAAIIAQFRDQAVYCRKLGSPFTGLLLDTIAELLPGMPDWAERILSWPGDPRADALALRVAGALHRAVLQGDKPLRAAYDARQIEAAALDTALRRNAALLGRYLAGPPQTNDPQRSAVLLGGFRQIAAQHPGLPLHCREIGASAGLNLSWDAYAYDFGSWRHNDAGAAPLHLAAEWQGAAPPQETIQAAIHVESRAGCDLAPLQAGNTADRERLLSYIWADQPQRLQRVTAALAHAVRQDIRVEAINAGDFLARALAQRPGNGILVLYHSIVWQYIAAAEQQRIAALMQAAGTKATKTAPLAWLRFEPGAARDGADLTLTLWDGREAEGHTQYLAVGDYHGRWVRWLA